MAFGNRLDLRWPFHITREGWWLRFTWVRLAFLFWTVCLVSAASSSLPAYSLGEIFVWFRFPLFAMAVAFWLGRDRRLVNAMLLSVGVGMLTMCLILASEVFIVGLNNGRLSWPYGDLVPGNYLAKACLPAFVVVVAKATSADGRTAICAAVIALISIVALVMTGERINFVIFACSGIVASVVWKPRVYRLVAVFAVKAIAVFSAIVAAPGLWYRFFIILFSKFQSTATANIFVRWHRLSCIQRVDNVGNWAR